MAKTETLTIRMTPETKAKLDSIARSTRRSRSFLASEALAFYVESEAAIVEGIVQAMAELDAGEGIPHEQVMREMDEFLKAMAEREAA